MKARRPAGEGLQRPRFRSGLHPGAPLLAALLFSLSGAAARATPCPALPGSSAALGEIDGETRLRFIAERLDHAARRARVWSWVFGGAYAGAGAINLALLAHADAGQRRDFYVGAASSGFGVATLLIAPPRVLADQRRLAALLRSAGPGTRTATGTEPGTTTSATTDRCAQLAQAERWLLRDAADDAFGHGALMHVGSLLYNVGVGLILAYALDRRDTGAITAAAGTVVGEIMIATRPTDAEAALRSYRAGQLGPAPPERPLPFALVPDLGPDRYGVRVALAF